MFVLKQKYMLLILNCQKMLHWPGIKFFINWIDPEGAYWKRVVYYLSSNLYITQIILVERF